ncbi:MAG: hypothetical protein CMM63_07745 [Rhodospirillaceae bacterium]|nr:hypothetical protein [Rhodospirillaceae bacterium]
MLSDQGYENEGTTCQERIFGSGKTAEQRMPQNRIVVYFIVYFLDFTVGDWQTAAPDMVIN